MTRARSVAACGHNSNDWLGRQPCEIGPRLWGRRTFAVYPRRPVKQVQPICFHRGLRFEAVQLTTAIIIVRRRGFSAHDDVNGKATPALPFLYHRPGEITGIHAR